MLNITLKIEDSSHRLMIEMIVPVSNKEWERFWSNKVDTQRFTDYIVRKVGLIGEFRHHISAKSTETVCIYKKNENPMYI